MGCYLVCKSWHYYYIFCTEVQYILMVRVSLVEFMYQVFIAWPFFCEDPHDRSRTFQPLAKKTRTWRVAYPRRNTSVILVSTIRPAVSTTTSSASRAPPPRPWPFPVRFCPTPVDYNCDRYNCISCHEQCTVGSVRYITGKLIFTPVGKVNFRADSQLWNFGIQLSCVH